MIKNIDIAGVKNPVDRFFAFARARHDIYLKRSAGKPWPWTADPVLSEYKFTNVFRELDRTTIWFREHVRDRLALDPSVLLATVVFRWFNRIHTGEAIFEQKMLGGMTPWEQLLTQDVAAAIEAAKLSIRNYCGNGPYVTGAYMLKSPSGTDKLTGILQNITSFMRLPQLFEGRELTWFELAPYLMENEGCVSLQSVWDWLRRFPFQGPFLAYEVATDLRHTVLLRSAPDISTWACAGPGAQRGLNRLRDRPLKKAVPVEVALSEMRKLLQLSRTGHQWPKSWTPWEMREVEHTLCEFDKYERTTSGEGTPKARYQRGQ